MKINTYCSVSHSYLLIKPFRPNEKKPGGTGGQGGNVAARVDWRQELFGAEVLLGLLALRSNWAELIEPPPNRGGLKQKSPNQPKKA